MPANESRIESSLADLTMTSLADLRVSDDERLRAAVTRLLDRVASPNDQFGGYRRRR
ncbi:hypothetical protein [Pseudofrankia asymbiotica]|uniref:hypothetical protein n=1 Tax=Pseudofrankia asymbiotica TaxID=1834516 RepID=UPI0013043BCC|nr:hypothetical protein [Pseudofrankia asymbiotica]